MATSLSLASSPGESAVAEEQSCALSFEHDDENVSKNVSFLMVGKGGSGKTSLVNAILKNDSSNNEEGVTRFGPTRGTELTVNKRELEVKEVNSTITIFDIMGLEDLTVPNESIVDSVWDQCDITKLCAIIICFKFGDRFDQTVVRILQVVKQLSPNNVGLCIWKKVVIALTHCDQLSPDLEDLDTPLKATEIKEIFNQWRSLLRLELDKLKVDKEIVDKLKIVPTTHTKKILENKLYGQLFEQKNYDWLENIWASIVSTVGDYHENESEVWKLVYALQSFFRSQCKKTVMNLTADDVQKFFTDERIKHIFLGGLVGSALGFLAGSFYGAALSALVAETTVAVIGASTVCVVGTAVTCTVGGVMIGGIIIGGAAVAALVGVVLYCKYKKKCKELRKNNP